MKKRKVSFQGEHGAYSDEVAYRALGKNIITVPQYSFRDIFESVEKGNSDLGIIPIENSLAGSIHKNYDLLLEHKLHIIGEVQLQIRHCLITNSDSNLSDIKIVRSHPQALAQCEKSLVKMKLKPEVAYDTAGSVRDLKESGEKDVAALASSLAAEKYGMKILKRDMQDKKNNFTRFLIVNTKPKKSNGNSKTSIVFSLKDRPGVLFDSLGCFSLRGIDLTKIESRPMPGSKWKYRFYLDFVANQHTGVGKGALAELAKMTTELRVLGSYPKTV